MPARTLYVVRHGEADALGTLTDTGREQCRLLGDRLAHVPVDAIWHSPLDRAAQSAAVIAGRMPAVLVDEAAELVDHVPHMPPAEELPPGWAGFFDGFDQAEAQAGTRIAASLSRRFAVPNALHQRATREVLVTHAYPAGWLIREALHAPAASWLSLTGIANTALTVLEFDTGELPVVIQLNDQSHLPAELRWTGFGERRFA